MENATLEIVERIQEKLSDHDKCFDALDQRFDRLEDLMRKQRRDVAGILVMMKGAAGEFDERITAMERRMDAMTAPRS